jgi:midasin
LSEILDDIRRRRDEILAQQERENIVQNRDEANTEAPGQVEYLQPDQDDQGMQALGPAGEEERQKLEDLNIIDEEMEQDGLPAVDDNVDDGGADETPAGSKGESTKAEQSHDGLQRESEKALTRSEALGAQAGIDGGDSMDIDDDDGAMRDEEDNSTENDSEDSDEIELRHVLAPTSSAQSQDTWRQYASLTADLSYALCEQLRLILEPTLATRLQGDFRTGKRLNMRKIIPYIASEYTKDKIWLRRTRPSKREYQVLLSVDDSRSMAESRSVHLAYQTLALVSQALTKLEVGQVAIAKFGERVDILHPFGDFSDVDGAKVVGAFEFKQQRTDVVALVDRTLGYLAEARQSQTQSTSSADLWQLQIIISDGICQDHERLRTLLRRALEQRVMIVFVIIDSLNTSARPTSAATTGGHSASGNGGASASHSSILSMQKVEYTKDDRGEYHIETKRYLDSFPFEYFVVLRDVEALPGVLADTLRQWVARVSQSQE